MSDHQGAEDLQPCLNHDSNGCQGGWDNNRNTQLQAVSSDSEWICIMIPYAEPDTNHTRLSVSGTEPWKMASRLDDIAHYKWWLHVCVPSYPCSLNWVSEAFFSTLTHVMLHWIATPGIKPSESLSTLAGAQLSVGLCVKFPFFFLLFWKTNESLFWLRLWFQLLLIPICTLVLMTGKRIDIQIFMVHLNFYL